jgi:hypothetical protein
MSHRRQASAGTRTPQGGLGKVCGGNESESGKSSAPPIAPLNSDHLSPELAKVVGTWPTLRPELRAAILAIIASVEGGPFK